MLPTGVCATVFDQCWDVPPIFSLIQKLGNVPDDDMKKTFNMGIGYVIVVASKDADAALTLLNKSGYAATQIGFIEKRGKTRFLYV